MKSVTKRDDKIGGKKSNQELFIKRDRDSDKGDAAHLAEVHKEIQRHRRKLDKLDSMCSKAKKGK